MMHGFSMETSGWTGATPARAEAGQYCWAAWDAVMVDRFDGDVTARCCTAAYRAVDADGYVVHVAKALGPEAA